MRTFEIRIDGIAKIQLADEVIDVVDDEWREYLYNLYTPDEIAAHVGYNLLVNNWKLTQMDGWADQKDENVRVIDEDWDVTACEV